MINSLQAQTQELVEAVEVVESVLLAQEKTWIPQNLASDKTFFGNGDIWVFLPSWDTKQCDLCGEYALGTPEFAGDSLRSKFPDLEVVDEDTINANVHPNCRCVLIRFSEYSKTKVI